MAKIERNAPCPCGSGKKYKNCCEGTKIVKRSPRLNQFFTGLVLMAGLAVLSVYYMKLGEEPAPAAKMQNNRPGHSKNIATVRRLDHPPNLPPSATAKPVQAQPGAGETTSTGLPNYPGVEPLPNVKRLELDDLKPVVRENIERISKQQKQQQTYPLTDQSKKPEQVKPATPPPAKDSTK